MVAITRSFHELGDRTSRPMEPSRRPLEPGLHPRLPPSARSAKSGLFSPIRSWHRPRYQERHDDDAAQWGAGGRRQKRL